MPLLLTACQGAPAADLAIVNATVFDARTGSTLPDHTVVIDDGIILSVAAASTKPEVKAELVVDAAGRLLTPGLVDVHHHSSFVLGDSVTATGGVITILSTHPDSLSDYRRRFAAEYLPYGVTTVREAGEDERYRARMVDWMRPVPWAPDFFASGGALVTREEGRVPYVGHTEVGSPEEAAAMVREYHALGFRHVKLYWRLREPEFEAAFAAASSLGMVPYAHIDFGVYSIGEALDLGVREFEHAYTLTKDILTHEDDVFVWNERTLPLTEGRREALFFVDTMEKLNYLGPDHPGVLDLIGRLAEARAAVTPTLHIFAQPYGLTYFDSDPWGVFDDTSALPDSVIERGRAGYRVLAGYIKRMADAGVRLNLGTDCRDPGKAALSEMILLNQLGLPMHEVLTIATWSGALALREEARIGSVEPGKKAHLVLFDKNPLEDPRHLLSGKTVIKDGVIIKADAGDSDN